MLKLLIRWYDESCSSVELTCQKWFWCWQDRDSMIHESSVSAWTMSLLSCPLHHHSADSELYFQVRIPRSSQLRSGSELQELYLESYSRTTQHVWWRRCCPGDWQWLRHVQGWIRWRWRSQSCLPIHCWSPTPPGKKHSTRLNIHGHRMLGYTQYIVLNNT